MSLRPHIKPQLIRWALDRSGIARGDLSVKFQKLPQWESGEIHPTLKQLEAFAHAVHVPIGYLFLSRPPEEGTPIPDFRTLDGHPIMQPSTNLLDTLYRCQERQSWYRNFARRTHQPAFDFVGNATVSTPHATVAAQISTLLGFDIAVRKQCQNWEAALRQLIRQGDDAGILVMVSSVVGSNNKRHLDVDEFRGFALSDPIAPLIFINGADTKAAQMFTLIHELAHLWLGHSALSNSEMMAPAELQRQEETWCNAVAAEVLVPLDALRQELRDEELRDGEHLNDAFTRLARIFKVSTLVILRRLLDANWLDNEQFKSAWAEEQGRLQTIRQRGHTGDGGNFYRTTLVRVSRRFARAVVIDTLEGQTLYRDAFRMLGVPKTETLHKIGREAGVQI